MIASQAQSLPVTPVTSSTLPGRAAGRSSAGRDVRALDAGAFDQLFDSVPLLGIVDAGRRQLQSGGAGFGGGSARSGDLLSDGGRREARLMVLRSDDASQRANTSSRIAGANIPSSEIAAERAAASSARNAKATTGGQGNPVPASTASASGSADRFTGTPTGSQATNDTAQSAAATPVESRTGGSSPNEPAVPDSSNAARPFPRTGPPAGAAQVRSPAARSPASTLPLSNPQPSGAGMRGSGRGEPRPFSQPASNSGVETRVGQDQSKTRDASAVRGAHRFGGTARSSSSQQTAFDRIAKVIQAGGSGRPAVVRISLDPPNLGHVQVHLRLTDDSIRVRLAAESPEARNVLLSQIDDLKSSLEHLGVKVHRLEVVLLQGEDNESPDDRGDGHFDDAASQREAGESLGDRQPTAAEDGSKRSTVAEFGAADDSDTPALGEDVLEVSGSPGEVRLDVRI